MTAFVPADNFISSLDPDKALQNEEPDLDPKQFDTLMSFIKDYLESVNS